MTQSSHVRSDNQIYQARNEFLNEPIYKSFFRFIFFVKTKKRQLILIINLSICRIFFSSKSEDVYTVHVHHFSCACVRSNYIYICLCSSLCIYKNMIKINFRSKFHTTPHVKIHHTNEISQNFMEHIQTVHVILTNEAVLPLL